MFNLPEIFPLEAGQCDTCGGLGGSELVICQICQGKGWLEKGHPYIRLCANE